MRTALWLLLLVLWFLQPAWAQGPQVAVRTGNHPGFGRVVFAFPGNVTSQMTRDGDRIILQFDSDAEIGNASSLPRNVLGVSRGKGHAELVVAPGAEIRQSRAGNRIVIDVMDPSAKAVTNGTPQAAPTPAHDHPVAAPVASPAPAQVQNEGAHGTPPTPSSAPPEASPTGQKRVPPVNPTPIAPASMSAQAATKDAASPVVAARASGAGSVFSLNFGAPVGAAAFRRGHTAYVVFDVQRPIDLGAVREDSVFGAAKVQDLAAATVMRVDLPEQLSLALSRQGETWTIAAVSGATELKPISVRPEGQELKLQAVSSAEVVAIVDADSGSELLVGTQRQSGEGVIADRSAPQFQLLATWQGVAVEPLADNLALRVASQQGFLLSAEPGGLAFGGAPADVDAEAAAKGLTRRFDFPRLPTKQLMARMAAAVDAAAAAPPLARGPLRRKAGEAMISLGLGAEAAAVLQLAALEDPREADEPDTIGLQAVAALLSGRFGEARSLSDPRLDGSDEITLWRAVRSASEQEGSPAAAASFAATLPLILSYPTELRGRLLPLALETMMAGGEKAVAEKALSTAANDPSLALAHGMLSEAKGDNDAALAVYDSLTNGRDQLRRARAGRRAIELRLSMGRLDARSAADALDRMLFAWRGDGRELSARLRVAELRVQAGSWRSALNLQRESENLFPDQKDMIHQRLKDTFANLLRDDHADKLAPLEFVAVIDENADLLPGVSDGQELEGRLADRLLALDLPKRAKPLLEKLSQQAPSPEARATFGERLAKLYLREGDPAQALAALKGSDADGLPSALAAQRTLTMARAEASRGDIEGAVTALRALGNADADEVRASLLEGSKDWAGAESALVDYVAKAVPTEGPLNDDQREIFLRLASDASQARNEATLISLRQRETKRMEGGALGDQFRLLTAASVRSVTDLPRAASEAGLARHVADVLGAPTPAGNARP
jgi:hypothetical protein